MRNELSYVFDEESGMHMITIRQHLEGSLWGTPERIYLGPDLATAAYLLGTAVVNLQTINAVNATRQVAQSIQTHEHYIWERRYREMERTHSRAVDRIDDQCRRIQYLETQLAERGAQKSEWEQKFTNRTQSVQAFLSELHAVMVDPLAEGSTSVDEMCALLLKAARENRQALYEAQNK